MSFLCTHCRAHGASAPFDSDAERPRCPACLRTTTVVSDDAPSRDALTPDAGQGPGSQAHPRRALGAPEPWPLGDACPLCRETPVGAALFYVQLSKRATALGGTQSAWLFVSGQACDACHARIVALGRTRLWSTLGFLAALGGFFVAQQLYEFAGLGRGAAFGVAGATSLGFAALALGLFGRANRRALGALDASWLLERARAAVPEPSGLLESSATFITATRPRRSKVVDLAGFAR